MFIADPPLSRATMNRANCDSLPVFTPRQGQYLAFIQAYTLVNGRPPAQADIQRFFQVTPPSVHQMLLTLERGGLISRRPGAPRSIAVLVNRSDLPALEPGYSQSVKITVTRYYQNHCDEVLDRVDIQYVQMNALMMDRMDIKARGVCS
jgi:hypothetical protein